MRRRPSKIGFVMLGGLLAVAQPFAQQPAPSQKSQTTFRASTHLIVHPVTVKDKQGKPILGLTARDFSVTENDVPQDIAFVEYQALDTSRGAPTTAVTGPPTARSSACSRRLLPS